MSVQCVCEHLHLPNADNKSSKTCKEEVPEVVKILCVSVSALFRGRSIQVLVLSAIYKCAVMIRTFSQ